VYPAHSKEIVSYRMAMLLEEKKNERGRRAKRGRRPKRARRAKRSRSLKLARGESMT